MIRYHEARPGAVVTRQMHPGFYWVYAQTTAGRDVVGMLFAEGVAGEHIIEHWVLSEGHASPNLDQSMVVERGDEEYASPAAFFAAMRTRTSDWQKVTYIKASCHYSDAIPEL